jgi:hypothetical protein
MKAPGLDKLITKLENRQRFLQSQDGREINLGTETTFVQGPFLHQETEEMSEEESLQFELENKELFRYLRSLGNQIEQTL